MLLQSQAASRFSPDLIFKEFLKINVFIAFYESHFSTMSSGRVTFYERIKMSQVARRVSEAGVGKAKAIAVSWGVTWVKQLPGLTHLSLRRNIFNKATRIITLYESKRC